MHAGVGAGGTAWESSLADWTWVMNVNLWGKHYLLPRPEPREWVERRFEGIRQDF